MTADPTVVAATAGPPEPEPRRAPLDYDPIATRTHHRVTVLYAVEASEDAVASASHGLGSPVWSSLKFDRLEASYRASQRQFPFVLARSRVESLEFEHFDGLVQRNRFWLIRLPNNLVEVALTVEVECDPAALILLLEDLHHRRVRIDGKSLWEGVLTYAPDAVAPVLDGLGLETYNLVHLDERLWDQVRGNGRVNVQLVSSLIYRFDEPYAAFSDRIKLPPESNRGAAFAATGPYVGVTVRNQGYVENAVLTSCMLFVGALMTLRAVREQAFAELMRARRFLAPEHDSSPTATRRQQTLLAVSAQGMARLQLDLSAGVEAFQRVASTVPSLRVTDFHEDLFESASITNEVQTVGAILERLGSALSAEAARRHAAERRADERNRVVRSVAFGVITTIALPLGIVFGFFGINGSEVHSDRSITDVQFYWVFYVALGTVIGAAVVIAVILHLWYRVERARERRHVREALLG
ncbi:hypothetical protein G5V58_17440 [Nocardioides anomalus]|uniref:Uncharacterized protein n=1 Tax=Nocardioides anomalus TaxID=2712223 RepID=A0A6G6WGG3_9ACTN|nr:hypothetical protein [Nocardioides anomalus]QIG44322.1 hypothetical protein G5V58_17440 [Nocardioides anomalus]